MEDIIQKYHKKKRKNTLAIICTSLALAVGLNYFFHNSQFGSFVKGSVMDATHVAAQQADLYLEIENNLVTLKASKDISNVKNMSFALAYDADVLDIKNKMLQLDNVEMADLANNEGYNTLLLNFHSPLHIKSGDKIVQFVLEKKSQTTPTQLNLTQANFVDTDNNLFSLSTSGVKY